MSAVKVVTLDRGQLDLVRVSLVERLAIIRGHLAKAKEQGYGASVSWWESQEREMNEVIVLVAKA